MTQQFPPSEFDDWADSYDESVRTDTAFPFDGYDLVLETIVKEASVSPESLVLDLGAGTGNLTALFLERDCRVWGVDFSMKMLEHAQEKLPQAVFAQADIREALPEDFPKRYHAVVSGYTFHHFPLEEKVRLVQRIVSEHLLPGGRLVIGDLMFRDAADEDVLRQKMGAEWEQEYFWLADETVATLTEAGIAARFVKLSSCAGVLTVPA